MRVLQLLKFNADGTYVPVTESSTGETAEDYGTWVCHGDRRATIRPKSGRAETGTVEWVNDNRYHYTTPAGVTIMYDRK